jgi:hypothetical protein
MVTKLPDPTSIGRRTRSGGDKCVDYVVYKYPVNLSSAATQNSRLASQQAVDDAR